MAVRAAEQSSRAAADTSTAADGPARGAGEATRESDISAAVDELRNADAYTKRQVQPLAEALLRDRFHATFRLLKERRLSSVVRDVAGLFVHLLKVELQAVRLERGLGLWRTRRCRRASSG